MRERGPTGQPLGGAEQAGPGALTFDNQLEVLLGCHFLLLISKPPSYIQTLQLSFNWYLENSPRKLCLHLGEPRDVNPDTTKRPGVLAEMKSKFKSRMDLKDMYVFFSISEIFRGQSSHEKWRLG